MSTSQPYGGLDKAFWDRKPLIGMVHLLPLPGSPRSVAPSSARVRGERSPVEYMARAVADATALAEGGVDALMIENFWDAPFAKSDVPPHTVAALTRAVLAVREVVGLPVGVNVLRNDARSAIAIAHVCGAQFVRINVFVGAAVTDQGIIEGAARDAVLYRRDLGADVALWADIHVKHASRLGTTSLEDSARDAVLRGQADALIVSGAATGHGTDPADIARVKAAVPSARVLVGSGIDVGSAKALLAHADGAIAGTSIKRDGDIASPVAPARVRALKEAMSR